MDTSDGNITPSESGLKLLIVDDDRVTRDLLHEVFTKEGYSVEVASSGEQALKKVSEFFYPIVISDIRMLEMDGLALLTRIKERHSNAVVILMTAFGSMETALEALKKGAFDYISKPFKMDSLKALVKRALAHIQSLGTQATPSPNISSPSGTIVGHSPKLVEVYKLMARASVSNSTVLIIGDTGTGKELVARGIHENSIRKNQKFIAINCGAVPENLLESELFGHVKGSFTGAISDKRGIFDEAHRGTLLLDEIGDISLPLQVKLLRVLQESEIRPVGGKESHRVDVRIIAATHRNLDNMVVEGKFREDLLYRLKVISVFLPPLKERTEDIPALVNHFLMRFSQKAQKQIKGVTDEAMESLFKYPWPGNVRELENAVERAIAMSRTDILYPDDFPEEVREMKIQEVKEEPALEANSSLGSLEDMERSHILKVLEQVNYNKSKASEVLGIDRATLYRKAQRYGISIDKK